MFAPQTPTLPKSSLERAFASSPLTSSPLAPPHSSPLDRLSRFKTQWHGLPSKSRPQAPRRPSVNAEQPMRYSAPRGGREEEPAKMLWRERLEQRCRERAREDRRQARSKGWGGSEEVEDDMDIEDEGADYLDDELIKRVLIADRRRKVREEEYLLGREVASSLDPDMVDIDALEREALSPPYDDVWPSQEPSPPNSEDEDMDPADLYAAYLAEVDTTDPVSPPTSPLPPSSPPVYPDMDDFDFDMDFDMELMEPAITEDSASSLDAPSTPGADPILSSCPNCGSPGLTTWSTNEGQEASCTNCSWTSQHSHHGKATDTL